MCELVIRPTDVSDAKCSTDKVITVTVYCTSTVSNNEEMVIRASIRRPRALPPEPLARPV